MYRITVDGRLIPGLIFRKVKPARETVDRLKHVYGMKAALSSKKPRPTQQA